MRDIQTSGFLSEFAEHLHGLSFPEDQRKEKKNAQDHKAVSFFFVFFTVRFGLTVCPGPLHSSKAVSAHPLCLTAAASSPPPVQSPWPGHPHVGFSLFKEHVNVSYTHRNTLYLTTADSSLLHLPPNTEEFL